MGCEKNGSVMQYSMHHHALLCPLVSQRSSSYCQSRSLFFSAPFSHLTVRVENIQVLLCMKFPMENVMGKRIWEVELIIFNNVFFLIMRFLAVFKCECLVGSAKEDCCEMAQIFAVYSVRETS